MGNLLDFHHLDTRPKKDSDDLRIILNLSYPYKGKSVNQSINKLIFAGEDNMELRYPSVDDLVKIIRRKMAGKTGKETIKLLKHDLSKAFRQLWMDPGSIHLLGYTFNGLMYFDVSLSMGSSSAVFCCQRTTNAITYIYSKFRYDDVNYLDDLGGAELEVKANDTFNCLGWILDTIGIKESRSKASAPACIMVFLGILFNTITMTLTITPERLAEIKNILRKWEDKIVFTLHNLQVLLGKLNFTCSTIRAGRTFLSRLINKLKNFGECEYRTVSEDMPKDIRWWAIFMSDFDGITVMPPERWDAPDLIFSMDASLDGTGGWSYRGNNKARAFHAKFPAFISSRTDVGINELELITFIVAIKKWGSIMQDCNILAYCNNQVTIDVIKNSPVMG